MAFEFIEHSKRIEAALRLAGCHEAAERFEDARCGSSTSGEILMRLRYESNASFSDDSVPQAVKDQMTALVHAINATGI